MLTEFQIQTSKKIELIEVTAQVKAAIRKGGISSGSVTVFVPHTTAGITINENADPDVRGDLEAYFETLVPRGMKFRHREGNSPSHILSTLTGCSQRIIIRKGQLLLGSWQGIYFCEFDGPRRRTVIVSQEGNEVSSPGAGPGGATSSGAS